MRVRSPAVERTGELLAQVAHYEQLTQMLGPIILPEEAEEAEVKGIRINGMGQVRTGDFDRERAA